MCYRASHVHTGEGATPASDRQKGTKKRKDEGGQEVEVNVAINLGLILRLFVPGKRRKTGRLWGQGGPVLAWLMDTKAGRHGDIIFSPYLPLEHAPYTYDGVVCSEGSETGFLKVDNGRYRKHSKGFSAPRTGRKTTSRTRPHPSASCLLATRRRFRISQ